MNIPVIFLLALEAGFALFLLYRAGLLTDRRRIVLSAGLVAAAFVLRGLCFSYETLDYQDFLAVWVDFYRTHGGLRALKFSVGNYNVPYLFLLALFSYLPIPDLYLIKLVSVFFDVVLAYAAMELVSRATADVPRRLFCFFAVLFWPTVVTNGALWGQCDSIYVAMAVLGIELALDDRPVLSMLSVAAAFAFKLQAVFVMPVYAVLWMQGKFQWKHFLLFPLAYVVLVSPALLAGRPFWDTVLLYFNQAGSVGSGLNYNSPSVFAIFRNVQNEPLASLLGEGAAVVYMLSLLGIAYDKRHKLNARTVIAFSVLFAVGIPFLLPHMHDRYFFAADILTLVMGCCAYEYLPAALVTEFASLLGYHAYLKMRYLLPMRTGAFCLLAVLIAAALFASEESARRLRP